MCAGSSGINVVYVTAGKPCNSYQGGWDINARLYHAFRVSKQYLGRYGYRIQYQGHLEVIVNCGFDHLGYMGQVASCRRYSNPGKNIMIGD